jgi:hypothetical protein
MLPFTLHLQGCFGVVQQRPKLKMSSKSTNGMATRQPFKAHHVHASHDLVPSARGSKWA